MRFTAFLAVALAAGAADRMQYPKTRTVDHVDVLHGIRVPDPYRWLEDAGSPDTKAWVQAQNAISVPFLRAIPEREYIREKLKSLYNYERFGLASKEGGRYLWKRNDGLQDRDVLYVSDTLNGAGEVLIDPNKFEDKTVALGEHTVDRQGRYLAYELQKSGSDWTEIALMDLRARKIMPDHLKWVKFSSPHWSDDGNGIYYSRYEEPDPSKSLQNLNINQKLYYHRIGTPQSEDRLIFFRPEEKNWMYGAKETADRKYLVLTVRLGSERKNAWFYRKLDGDQWVELLPKWDSDYLLIGTEGSRFFFRTTLDAPRGRVIAVDVNRPDRANWTDVIPEGADVLTDVAYVNGTFIASYLRDARSAVRLFDRTGKAVGEVDLPGIGRTTGFEGRQEDTEVFYQFTSYTVPPAIYRFDLKTRKSTLWKQPKVPVDLSRYETRLVFYNSKDGARVPMFVTARKDLRFDGNNPVYLYAYGGFNLPVTPAYNVSWVTWLEMGGVFANPAIRGGGEYGREWHLAGTKERKQNVFNDFIAAAEYLIAQKYTKPERLVISGRSNGGLLVGACLLQRPELFGAALPVVGVLDMLRFHKFTIGWGWVGDYGSPDNPKEFKALYAYSPYHNIKPGVRYPPTLITTADHDDRVVPAHSFKFAAALQAAQAGDAPILIRIQTSAGHGSGRTLSMLMEEQVDSLAFAVKNLGIDVKRGRTSD